MTKSRRTYTGEFKREALRLLETSGKSAAQLERELGIDSGCLSRSDFSFLPARGDKNNE